MTSSDPPLRVLLVEDDFDVAEGLGEYLARHGVEVDFAATANEALHVIADARFDVLVFDVQLPGEDGISLCRRLAAAHGPLPVLFLTAMGSLDSKLAAFDAGALDYVVKPFEPAELLARLRAIVGRAGATAATAPLVLAAGYRLDPDRHLLLHDERHLGLTALAARLLECLMRAYPGTVTRDALHEALWHGPPPDSDPLRTHVHHLRRQAEATFGTALIATVRGVGYRFDPNAEDADARPAA